MFQKIGVNCKSCGERIPVEDEYVPGIGAAPLAASFYQIGTRENSASVNQVRRKSLSCENPDCRQTHNYACGDLVLYND